MNYKDIKKLEKLRVGFNKLLNGEYDSSKLSSIQKFSIYKEYINENIDTLYRIMFEDSIVTNFNRTYDIMEGVHDTLVFREISKLKKTDLEYVKRTNEFDLNLDNIKSMSLTLDQVFDLHKKLEKVKNLLSELRDCYSTEFMDKINASWFNDFCTHLRIEAGSGIINSLFEEILMIKNYAEKPNADKKIDIIKGKIKDFLNNYSKLYIYGDVKKNPDASDYKMYYTKDDKKFEWAMSNGNFFDSIHTEKLVEYSEDRIKKCQEYGISVDDLNKLIEELKETDKNRIEDIENNKKNTEENSFSRATDTLLKLVKSISIDPKDLKKKINPKNETYKSKDFEKDF